MYVIAHINITRARFPFSDPIMAEFNTLWKEVNIVAEHSPGFIWHIPDDDPAYNSPYEDKGIVINMSVWATVSDFASFVFSKDHQQVMKRRREWFERMDGPYQTLWWVPQGYIPTTEEAKQRLDHLRRYGPTPYAFTLKQLFPPPDGHEQASE